MMKVLQINTEKTWRGGERQTLYLCEGLLSEGIDVTLLARKDYPLYHKAISRGIPTVGINGSAEAIHYLLKNSSNFDIIHSQTGKGVSLALSYRLISGNPPLFYTRRVDFRPKGVLTIWKYKKIDCLIGISRAICHILEEAGFSNIEYISSAVVPRNPDRTRAEKFLKTLGINKKYIVGSIAALVPHKDPMTLLEAARQIAQTRDDVAFVLFGDGPLKEMLLEKINEHGLQNIFFLAGFQDDVEDFYSIFDLFVMTSLEEGLGSSVLDAFYYGVPVVATQAGGLAELVNGRGELCPTKNPDCLAAKINLLLENEELRTHYTEVAKHYVEKNHALKSIVKQYISLYQKFRRANATD